MNYDRKRELLQALLIAPAGAALLAHLEVTQRTDDVPSAIPPDVDAVAIRAAIEALHETSVGALLATAVEAAEDIAGPWSGNAPTELAAALSRSTERAELGAAIIDRLEHRLDAPSGHSRHEWWWSNHTLPNLNLVGSLGSSPRRPCPSWVTATFDGLWTVTEPEDDLADPLVGAWEVFPGPISRWRVHVDDRARIYEVRGPADWAHLVTQYPLARRSRPNSSWEIPGINQHGIAALAAMPGQHAMRTTMRNFVEPDWDGVAQEWDAVHLTWSGFLTCEGFIIDLPSGDVAMLRNWNSERTLWLNQVLSVAEPLPAPALSGRINDDYGIDPRTDPARLAQDLEVLRYCLGEDRSSR